MKARKPLQPYVVQITAPNSSLLDTAPLHKPCPYQQSTAGLIFIAQDKKEISRLRRRHVVTSDTYVYVTTGHAIRRAAPPNHM